MLKSLLRKRIYETKIVMNKKRVCITGAGAAGLIALRHVREDPDLEGCIFEQTNSVGGIWKYVDKTGNDEYGIPIHSTAYKGLRTNLPKEIMGYLDYKFPDSEHSYINHEEVFNYFKTFADSYKLLEDIHFTTRVINIQPNVIPEQPEWKVTTENLTTRLTTEHFFDSIIVCNGHYTKPYLPNITNLKSFKGEIFHSRDYRTPNIFLGKRVIVLGAGPSAIDISIELVEFASQVILSCNESRCAMPNKILIHSPVTSAKENSFITATGNEIECDVLLLCSGYVYDFPFLSPDCGITVEEGKYIYPLYRHMINAMFPTMILIGIPFTVCPFPQFDCQIRYFLQVIKGKLTLPSKDEMLQEIKKEERERLENKVPLKHSHKFGDKQWEYNIQLAKEAGFLNLIQPVIQKVYDRAGLRRLNAPANYKHDHVTIIDRETFEYVEDLHTPMK
ncbi:unnamed protein product [Orchesella dallaii]|uniref:Flavin-containing monooxygenase n=1 Tax=Orchesella dallaii TaxID=48710 RepID=A0ABP1RDW2_9HEXA